MLLLTKGDDAFAAYFRKGVFVLSTPLLGFDDGVIGSYIILSCFCVDNLLLLVDILFYGGSCGSMDSRAAEGIVVS